MATRGFAAIAAARVVAVTGAAVSGTCPGADTAPGCGIDMVAYELLRGCRSVLAACCCACSCRCFHLRMPIKYCQPIRTRADSAMAMIVFVIHPRSVFRAPLVQAPRRPLEILAHPDERQCKRRAPPINA